MCSADADGDCYMLTSGVGIIKVSVLKSSPWPRLGFRRGGWSGDLLGSGVPGGGDAGGSQFRGLRGSRVVG